MSSEQKPLDQTILSSNSFPPMSNILEEVVSEATPVAADFLTVIGDHNLHMLSTCYGASAVPPSRMQMETLSLKHDWTLPYCVWVVFGECDAKWLDIFMALIHKTSNVVWIDSSSRDSYGLSPTELDGLGDLLAAGRLKIITGGRIQEKGSTFSAMMDTLAMDHWKPVISIDTLKQRPVEAKQLITSIAEGLTTKILSENTAKKVGFKFLRTALINAPLAITGRNSRLLEKICLNRPLVLVATGPSLNKQLPTLRANKDLFCIIAVDTAWPILKENGIIPDVILGLDPNSRPSWFDEGLGTRTIAALDLSCSPELVWSNISYRLFSYSDPEIYKLANLLGASAGPLPTGGSVATQAFNLAVSTGANPIILIGQDLALTGGKDHADGYLFKYNSKQLDHRREAGYDVPGYHGGTVRTERQLLAYKTWYQQRIASLPDLTVINSTEGGACIEGSLQIPFELVCQEIRKAGFRKPSMPLAEIEPADVVDTKHVALLIQNLDKFKVRVKDFMNLSIAGLKLTGRSSSYIHQDPGKLAKIDRLNEKIRKVDSSVKLIVGVFGVAEYETISKDASRSEKKLTFSEELKYYDRIYQQMNRSAHLALEFLAQVRLFYGKLLQEKSFDIRLLHETFGRQCEKLNVFDQTAK